MSEQWRSVVGFEGTYVVSDAGNVQRIAGGRGARAGQMVKQRDNGHSYAYVVLCTNGVRVNRAVHVMVAAAFIGPRGDGMEVNHRNGVKMDNRLSNLEYLSRLANARHARYVLGRVGGQKRGLPRPGYKLNEDKVRLIRNAVSDRSYGSVAREFGVSAKMVSHIVNRKAWAWVV